MKHKPGVIIFKKEDWALITQIDAEAGTRRAHYCKWDNKMEYNTVYVDSTECDMCHTKVPDEIQGLWQIANWERLYNA